MRTNIVINNKLMSQALKFTGLKTKREAVEAGLEMLLKWPGRGKFVARAANSARRALSVRRAAMHDCR